LILQFNQIDIDIPYEYKTSEIFSATIIQKFKLADYQNKTISSLNYSHVGHFGLERTMKRLLDVWINDGNSNDIISDGSSTTHV
jgi:hypothetical protein